MAVVGIVAALLQAPAARAVDTNDWLGEANHLRSFWNVPVPILTEDADLSANNAAHNRYLDENQNCVHEEDPANPYYSDAGNYGGTHSVVYCAALGPKDDVDGWASTPLHGEQVLNPQLTVTGFDESSLNGGHATMDTLTHAAGGAEPTVPVTWPNGDDFPLTSYPEGGEFDFTGGDTITDNCSAEFQQNRAELGPPLFVDFPGTAHSATPASDADVELHDGSGTSIPVCLFDAASNVTPYLSTAILLPLHRFVPGTHYEASYTAGGLTGTWSFTTAGHVPDAPTDLTITAGNHALTAAWTPPSDAGGMVTGYDVQYSDDGGSSWTSASDDFHTDPATTQTITGLTNGTDYLVRVAAIDSTGTGAYATASGSARPVADPASAPATVTATAGIAAATVQWSAPGDDGGSAIVGYDVQYAKTGGPWTSSSAAFRTDTSRQQTVTGLANGVSYRFRVAAVTGVGTGAYSAPSAAVTPQAPQSPPPAQPTRPAPHATRLASTATHAVAYRKPTTLTATLTDAATGRRVGGARLVLVARSASGARTTIGTATTQSNGVARARVRPARNTQYLWSFAGSPALAAANAAPRTVFVHAAISGKLAHKKVKLNRRVVLRGTVHPVDAGSIVRLQGWDGKHWRTLGVTAVVSRSGKYALLFSVTAKGRFRIRARYDTTSNNAAGASRGRWLRIV